MKIETKFDIGEEVYCTGVPPHYSVLLEKGQIYGIEVRNLHPLNPIYPDTEKTIYLIRGTEHVFYNEKTVFRTKEEAQVYCNKLNQEEMK